MLGLQLSAYSKATELEFGGLFRYIRKKYRRIIYGMSQIRQMNYLHVNA